MNESNFVYKIYKNTASSWEAMYESLLNAKKSIFWEIYIFIDDEEGKKFVEVLAQKAREGLEIKLILDALGSSGFSESSENYLIKSGVKILRFNRLHPRLNIWNWYYRLLHRNHRKVLIIDEEVVFLGGVNIRADFKNWNDVYIKISGRISQPLLRGFARSYISCGGKKSEVKKLLKRKIDISLTELTSRVNFIVHSPSKAKLPKTKLFYIKAFAAAKERVNILTPYYVPDNFILQAIKLATRRGVKVNIFLPLRSDLLLMELLSKTYFESTLKAGASIYLLREMNHGKALSVDSNIGLVGSINLMKRSFSHQEESAVAFNDSFAVADLNAMFEELKAGAEQLTIENWLKRPLLQRFREWLAKRIEYFIQ